jgi:hypothetical protein
LAKVVQRWLLNYDLDDSDLAFTEFLASRDAAPIVLAYSLHPMSYASILFVCTLLSIQCPPKVPKITKCI